MRDMITKRNCLFPKNKYLTYFIRHGVTRVNLRVKIYVLNEKTHVSDNSPAD